MNLSDLDELARQHHGVVTRAMFDGSDHAWWRAIRAGMLIQVHPGVARLPGTADTPEQRIAAAVLATHPHGLASHRSAAHLWGIPRHDDDPVDIILPGRSRQPELDGVEVHRPRDSAHLTPPQRRSNIRCTNIIRTLCDLGAVDAGAVEGAVGHVLTTNLASLDALEAGLVPALRAAIDAWRIDGRPADSVLEPAMLRLVERYGLPPVQFHPWIDCFEVDFRVIGTPIILECDGWTAHGLNPDQFEYDRLRDGRLAAAGWIVVRFTYRAIIARPARTAARIREVVARWGQLESPDGAPPVDHGQPPDAA
jgi:very-short-patch-repair endonuclease